MVGTIRVFSIRIFLEDFCDDFNILSELKVSFDSSICFIVLGIGLRSGIVSINDRAMVLDLLHNTHTPCDYW